ncbi:Acid phosphatase [Parasponia andersonii]|uniref:Purple acid phosphatase n=1 Tax=Parasponia andersonii TaxID=3476 RepID=A0A2P5DVK5_PARAD|nr:Acid phosphatase [Parasponia andersonii]
MVSLGSQKSLRRSPLSKIAILNTKIALYDSASIYATPVLLQGQKGDIIEEDTRWVTVTLKNSKPENDDWVGVFSPAKFDSSTFPPNGPEDQELEKPYICSAPIKADSQILNWWQFQMPLSVFANPKAPLYPRLALGKAWDETKLFHSLSGGLKGEAQVRSPAGTLTYDRSSMCGAPARTVGWRHPGYIHTSFLKELWPNSEYTYRMGHSLLDGSYVWSKSYSFESSPYPGQDSLQRIIVFGDMGKAERDGSNEYANTQPGSLNTTDQLVKNLKNYDIVFHIGDMAYANGYLSEWDQFIAQVSPISSAVPQMGPFGTTDSGGECGVPAETLYYVPADNRAKFWYSADYGMFKFCVAESEHDWRAGLEQYKWIEKCLASADRRKQPWLIFMAHRVLGYPSNSWYGQEGSFAEPEGRDDPQKLWQRYKVDIAVFGHVHNYERICPIYQNQCVNSEKSKFSGVVNATIHVVTGGGGKSLAKFSSLSPVWSVYRDYDWGFVKLTAFNHSSLLFEYKKSRDGQVYDSFTIYREYKDVLACIHDGCEPTTLAS